MELGEWQVRLENHFDQLLKDRSAISIHHPIYGLEHGLGKEDLKSLSGAIKEQILQMPPSKDHQLVWIVYATEIGYNYAGDEYWQTFERETPGWTLNGDRYWLRTCFFWFHDKYGGAKPTGRWAEHFSIICWPITHAVLPKDLQRQLARILFELRHTFSAELFESPTTFGERIAVRSWNGTSRFQNFVEETQLVGQIGTALLLQGKFGTAGLLQEATLQRISDDLDRERMAREWLRSARKEAEKRVTIRGLAFSHGRFPPTESSLKEIRSEVQALGIEPRLILKPRDVQKNSWEVLLEIPDFSHLLFNFPHLRNILTGSRCIVAGSSGRPLPRGCFLYGSKRIQLVKWPKSDEVLLEFDQKDIPLEYLLRTECLLRPGPTWLFRIASDNLAYETRSLSVRPGQRYLIVNSDSLPNNNEFTKPVNLTCDGAYSALINLPQAFSEEWEEWLLSQGVGLAKTIEVWPAGLGAVVWDGEGYGEWVASERPCLGIRSDHYIDSLLVSMDIGPNQSIEILPVTPGEPIFLELPELPVGLHSVKFLTRRATLEEEELGDLDVIMRIREARPWSPGISPQGPLLVQIDPASPTLEQLWEGKIEIALKGPRGRQVECKVSFFETNAKTATLIRQLPSLELPISPDSWRDYFEKYFKKLKDVEIAYDSARSCKLDLSAGELGAFSIRCEREFTPLRWVIRREKQGYIAQIFDDSGNSAFPTIVFYTFEEPSIKNRIEHISPFLASNVGGLYVADQEGNLRASIIIPPAGIIKSFSALHATPRFDKFDRNLEAIVRLLCLSELWANARLPGDPLSSIRQRDVLLEVIRQLFLIFGGKKWVEVEASISDRNCDIMELAKKVSKQVNDMGFIESLAKQYEHLTTVKCKERINQLASLGVKLLHLTSVPPERTIVSQYLIRKRPVQNAENPTWLCELVLRLASDPSIARAWAGNGLHDGIEKLLKNPILAMAARFLVLAIAHRFSSTVIPGKLYPSWEWT